MNTFIILFVFISWIALIFVFGIMLEMAEKKLKEIKTKLKDNHISSINEKVRVR